jgi:hypothetical protein
MIIIQISFLKKTSKLFFHYFIRIIIVLKYLWTFGQSVVEKKHRTACWIKLIYLIFLIVMD